MFDQAELLAQLIEDKDLRDLTLVGHSFGGGVALLLALEANQRLDGRIARLVLLNSIAYPQNIPVFFRLLDMPLVSQVGVRMVPPSVQTRVALQIAYFDDSKIDPEEVEIYAAPLKTAAGKHAIIHSARQIVPEDIAALSERYKTIELPTLILWCDHDRIVPLEVGLKLRRTLPNSTLRLVEGCGHMPQEEQPASDARADQGLHRRLTPRPFAPISIPYRGDRQIRFALIVHRNALCRPRATKTIESPIGEKHGRQSLMMMRASAR